mgnify:CR=1 FL=1
MVPGMVLAAQFNLDSNEAKAYIAIAVGVMGLAYLWLRSISKKRRSDPLERAPFAGLSKQRSVEREFQNLLVEMAEMSRQISAQLDTRSEKLNLLVIEADAKIAELRSLQGQVSESGSRAANPLHAVAEAADRNGLQGEEPPSDQRDPRHYEIYALAEQGLPAQEIARRLDRHRGEVELILALRNPSIDRAQRAVG